MSRKPITKLNIMEKEPYRSILNILHEFQDCKDGVLPMHFRYLLIPNNDKEHLSETSLSEIREFFLNKVEELTILLSQGYIQLGSVTSNKNLNKFLHKLLELGLINKKDDSYCINKDFSDEIRVMRGNSIIATCYQTVSHLNHEENRVSLLYGFPEEIINQDIKDRANKINMLLTEMHNIKDDAIIEHYSLKFKDLTRNMGNTLFKKILSSKFFALMFIGKVGCRNVIYYPMEIQFELSENEQSIMHLFLNKSFNDLSTKCDVSINELEKLYDKMFSDENKKLAYDVGHISYLNHTSAITKNYELLQMLDSELINGEYPSSND